VLDSDVNTTLKNLLLHPNLKDQGAEHHAGVNITQWKYIPRPTRQRVYYRAVNDAALASIKLQIKLVLSSLYLSS
jgi:hypothetical protein